MVKYFQDMGLIYGGELNLSSNNVVFIKNYSPNADFYKVVFRNSCGPIAQHGEELSQFINSVKNKTGKSKVTLIAHYFRRSRYKSLYSEE